MLLLLCVPRKRKNKTVVRSVLVSLSVSLSTPFSARTRGRIKLKLEIYAKYPDMKSIEAEKSNF